MTTLPHIRDFSITGPHAVTGVSETPSRRRIFSCRPTSAADERTCAASILKRLATQAYRRPATSGEIEPLLKFYDQGRKDGGFEAGIRLGLQAILDQSALSVPHRRRARIVGARRAVTGSPTSNSRRGCRSCCGTPVPTRNCSRRPLPARLRTTVGLDTQVRRMLADPRSEALSRASRRSGFGCRTWTRFVPTRCCFPAYDETLAQSFKRETELLFNSIVREDRNVLDLFTADYTFVNERLARHYGIPGVVGDDVPPRSARARP